MYSRLESPESANMSASFMTSAPDDDSTVIDDTVSPSCARLRTSLFWLLLREYFWGDLLPLLEVFREVFLLSDCLPLD